MIQSKMHRGARVSVRTGGVVPQVRGQYFQWEALRDKTDERSVADYDKGNPSRARKRGPIARFGVFR